MCKVVELGAVMAVAWLTVLSPLSKTAAQDIKLGLIVEGVAAESPAERIGVRVGDRILIYDDRRVTSPAAWQLAQENTFARKEVTLRLQREGETLTVKAPPGNLGATVRPELATTTVRLYEDGRAALKAKNVNDAINLWRQAAKAALEEGEEEAAPPWLYGRIAEVYESQRQWKQANDALSSAWEILRRSRDSAAQSRTLWELGWLSHEVREFAAATQWFEQALQVDEAAGNEIWVALDLNGLGNVTYSQSNFQEARDYYGRALAIRERLIPDSLDAAASLNNMGLVDSRRGDFQAAQDYHRRALAIRERLAPNSGYIAASLNNLGLVASRCGDLQAAKDYHLRALAIFERLRPNSASVALGLNNLGVVAGMGNDLQTAQQYFERALAIREKLDPDSLSVATNLDNLGLVAGLRLETELAENYHNRALAIRNRLAPNSLAVADSISSLGNLASVRGDDRTAEVHHNRALAIRERLAPASLAVAESLTSSAELAVKSGHLADARQLFARAVDIIENHRRTIPSTEGRALFLAQHTRPFSGLLEAYVELKDLPSAFATLERARARSLVEKLAEQRFDLGSDAPPALLKRQQELDRKRSAAYSSLAELNLSEGKIADELRRELANYDVDQRELEAQMRRSSPRFANLRYPTPLDLSQAQAALDEGTLLLAYYVDDPHTHLFVVGKREIKLLKLPVTKKALTEEATIFHEELTGKRLGDPNEQGQKLYDLLVRPAQDWVNHAKRVLICPDGPLRTLPFAALVSQSKPNTRYFIEDQPLHTIVSMTVYAEIRRRPAPTAKSERRVLALGDAIYAKSSAHASQAENQLHSEGAADAEKELAEADSAVGYARGRGFRLDRLPNSRKEVEEIGKLFGKSATLRLDLLATETAVRQESRDHTILHFAIHGWFDDQIGLNSGLVLTRPELLGRKPTREDNGLLQAWEIFDQLRLKADLVVLSACDSGLGQEMGGEGLIGLTRSLQYAGARSVAVSLWEVDDASTAELMKAFYRQLQKGTSKDVALQNAMVAVRSSQTNPKWRHPRYWSAFVLAGSWD